MRISSLSLLSSVGDKPREAFTLQVCHNNFRVKFRCQAQSITIHYQLSPDDCRFNFAAQQSSVQRKVAADEAVTIIRASCLKIIQNGMKVTCVKQRRIYRQSQTVFIPFSAYGGAWSIHTASSCHEGGFMYNVDLCRGRAAFTASHSERSGECLNSTFFS